MLRKYSIRLRETTKQIEELAARAEGVPAPAKPAVPEPTAKPAGTVQAEAMAYFISKATRQRVPGVQDRVADRALRLGDRHVARGGPHQRGPSRNISRRHARLVMKDGKPYVAEEIGTMNGTFLNGQKLADRRPHADQGRRRAHALPPGPDLPPALA